jgi:hypothetical protein
VLEEEQEEAGVVVEEDEVEEEVVEEVAVAPPLQLRSHLLPPETTRCPMMKTERLGQQWRELAEKRLKTH